jgi:hypothetical protein
MKIVAPSLAALALCLAAELGRFLQEAAARGPGRCDLRTANPPRIDQQSRWTGADGAEVRAGTRRLRDSNYLTHAAPVTADHLRYEKAPLLDWLQRELRAPAGS